MTETGFGPGGYAATLAAVPNAPILAPDSSHTLVLTIAPDVNPAHTEYAIRNATGGCWTADDGAFSAVPVWRTRVEWGTVTLSGLNAGTAYVLSVRARNTDGLETANGPSASLHTHWSGTDVVAAALEVIKASSSVSPPAFMASLAPQVRIAGKALEDFGFRADSVGGLDMPAVVAEDELVPGSHTWRVNNDFFAPKEIVLEGYMHAESSAALRLRMAYLKSFLATFGGTPWRSSQPVRLDRSDLPNRHWRVHYRSIEVLEFPGGRIRSSMARIRIRMKAPSPFALSDDVTRARFTPSAGGFRPLELGNAPSNAVYVIEGPAVNPSFTVGDAVFLCDFSDGLLYTDVSGCTFTGTYTPPSGESAAFRTTETGTGILVTGTATVSYTATGNPSDCAWVAIVHPEWTSSARATDAVILEHRADAGNFVRLGWSASGRRWEFTRCAGGSVATVVSVPQAFVAGDRLVLGITADATNAGGMKLFVNGTLAGSGDSVEELAATPDTLTLHAGDGTGQPDAVYDAVAGWSRMISSDEMLRIAADPTTLANLNETVSYTGTLDTGDRLALDSETMTAVLHDLSGGTRTNALDDVTGTIPALTPGRRRTATDSTQTVVHTATGAGSMEIRYRRRYL